MDRLNILKAPFKLFFNVQVFQFIRSAVRAYQSVLFNQTYIGHISLIEICSI